LVDLESGTWLRNITSLIHIHFPANLSKIPIKTQFIDKLQSKPKGQSRLYNPEKLATFGHTIHKTKTNKTKKPSIKTLCQQDCKCKGITNTQGCGTVEKTE
jgi:hypothetical protein